ncbi:MAG: VTT domain-containing protein [Clostridia bacterium]|nr:VTT domain-containing protein [Clostridia bacterium]
MTEKRYKFIHKLLFGAGLVVLVLVLCAFMFSGDNTKLLKALFVEGNTREELQGILSDLGIKGYISAVILSVVQIVLTFLPAEPVQVLAGVAFGVPVAVLCYTVALLLGNTIIFVLYKFYGDGIRDYFSKNLHFDLNKAARNKSVMAVIIALYLVPAIPYGAICFLAASVGMKYRRYIFVTTLGALPSALLVITLGDIVMSSSLAITVAVFAVTVLLVILALVLKKQIIQRINLLLDAPAYSSATTVKPYGSKRLDFLYFFVRIWFFLCGIRIKYTNKLDGELPEPSIVLCNHGSFVDFVYAGALIRKKSPHFIVARLYFYKKWLGKLLKAVGCFPKSMFAQDLESAKNCLTVLKKGRVLAMMPEARLSTTGRFEDIQPGTYLFLKRAGVPIYTVKIHGDYLADPKWGKGMRRGALVEAELDILFTKEELAALDVEEIRRRTEERLRYDEFEWLKSHPKVKYRSSRIAEGLENILSKCPVCGQKHILRTKGREVFCENCGKIATMDERYNFVGSSPFANLAEWYDWQMSELLREIVEAENADGYILSATVELRQSSTDAKTMTRHTGNGTCYLNKTELKYVGTQDGKEVELKFPLASAYRILFGAGENFETYVGNEIYYFVPENKRSAVEWYMASVLLAEASNKQ